MKSQKLRLIVYIIFLVALVVVVQLKKASVTQERSKKVVSLPNEIKKHGIPIDVEKINKREFLRATRVTASKISAKKAHFLFTKNEASQFKPQQKALNINDHQPIGIVTSVSKTPSRNTGLYKGVIQFDKPKESGAVDIVIDRSEKKVSIPIESIDSFREKNKNYVWLSSDGKAKLADVKLGEQGLGRIEVLDGLKIGDLVVTNGWKSLEEDDRTRTRQCQYCDNLESGVNK